MKDNDPIRAQELLDALEENPWTTYIEVLAENGNVAIQEIDDHLNPNSGIQKTVEITGIGGLGKTSVAREYMKRCIRGQYNANDPYSFYFYYTAKGEMGEVETRFGQENFIQSSGWDQGGGIYLANLDFYLFLSQICSSLNLDVDLNVLTQYLREHRVLIVLDNFEDVNDENKKHYIDFLMRIRVKETRSRVIITSRKQKEFKGVAEEIPLRELEGAKGTELIYQRYRFLARNSLLSKKRLDSPEEISEKEHALHRNYIRVTQFIDQYLNRQATLTRGNPDDLVADLVARLDEVNREDVMLNLRHPIMLMRIASLLNSQLVDDVSNSGIQSEQVDNVIITDNRSVLDILLSILSDPKHLFLEFKRNVIKYITTRAWDSILKEEYCREILEILYHQTSMRITYSKLRAALKERTKASGSIYDAMERAIKKIRTHSVFLVEEDDDEEEDFVQLLESARTILSTILPDAGSTSAATKKAEPKIVDLVEKLKPKQTVASWSDFAPLVQEFCLAVTQPELKQAVGKEKLDEIEEALYSKLTDAKMTAHIEENMAAAVRFIAHAKNKERGVKFTIDRLDTLIQAFSTLQPDSLDFLCSNWFSGENRLKDKANVTQMRLVVLLLTTGIQQNLGFVRQLFFKLLKSISHEDLIDAFDSINERQHLGTLLSRYANYIEWNLETQHLFSELNVELSLMDRFKVGVVGDYTDQKLEILHHPKSETTDDNGSNACYVCQGNGTDRTVMLYIRKPKPAVAKPASPHRTPEFNKWLSSTQTDHPGLSADLKTFAADILAVSEFYNEHFIQNGFDPFYQGPFSTAQKMKRNFSSYHTNEKSATSLAFIIGYRADKNHLNLDDMHKHMVEEVLRRLNGFQQPNIYFRKEQIRSWNNLFVSYVEEAKALIQSSEDEIRKLMMARMRNDTLLNAEPRLGSKQNPRKKANSQHERIIPRKLSDFVSQMAGRPMLNEQRLRQGMKARVGKIAYDTGVDFENRKNNRVKFLNLPHTWVDTICGVIFSRPLRSDFSRYSVSEVPELLEEILTTHFG